MRYLTALLALFALVLLAPTAPGQAGPYPIKYSASQPNSAIKLPNAFGIPTTHSFAAAYDNVPAGTITGITFRPAVDHTISTATTFGPYTFPTVKVDCYSTPLAAASIGNYTAFPAVTSVGPVTFPAYSQTFTSPQTVAASPGYVWPVNLAAPFTHTGGTLVVSVSLVVPPGAPTCRLATQMETFGGTGDGTAVWACDLTDTCGVLDDAWTVPMVRATTAVIESINVPPTTAPGPGEADFWTVGILQTGVALPCPIDNDWSTYTATASMTASLGLQVIYAPGLEQISTVFCAQRLRILGTNAIASGPPLFFRQTFNAGAAGTTSDMGGANPATFPGVGAFRECPHILIY